MALDRSSRAARRRPSARRIRDRLNEAEATLEAIRSGQVDALVVSGPQGDRTLTIEGATHPYFVLLDAMRDGAALLEPTGTILFGNRSLGEIVETPVGSLLGSEFQQLVVTSERAGFGEFLRQGIRHAVSREFALSHRTAAVTSVAISLSALPLGTFRGQTATGSEPGDGAVLMAIVTDLTYRKSVEATRARLLARLISAEDDERRRIARELHDETGQSLTALLVGLRTIADMAVRQEVRDVVLRLRDIAAHTVDDVGRLARGLHPAVLDDKGLGAAARRYAGDFVRSFGTSLTFTAGELDTPRLSPLASATVYRILQETLTNVARHAQATAITVDITRTDAALELLVKDDGIGFDVDHAHEALPGLGLHGMRERVTLLGGAIHIESSPGHGTIVRATIPTENGRRVKISANGRTNAHPRSQDT